MAIGYLDLPHGAAPRPAVPPRPIRPFRYEFGRLAAYLDALRPKLRIAVVHGGDKDGDGAVIRRTHNTRPWKSYRTVAEDVAGALANLGFAHVTTLADDMSLAQRLVQQGIDLVWLNTGGVQGYNPVSHTPALLEMLGVPYVGHNSLAASVLDNKHTFKRVLSASGIRTAPFVAWHPEWGAPNPAEDERFKATFDGHRGPFVLKPVSGRASLLVLVAESPAAVGPLAEQIYEATRNTVLIEPFLAGREFCVSVCGPVVPLGQDFIRLSTPFAFSAAERVLADGETIFTSMDLKPISGDRVRVLGREDAALRVQLLAIAERVYREFELESIARVDVRADAEGNLCVLEANPKPDLKKPTADVTSLVACGLAEHRLDYDGLILALLADRLDGLLRHRAGDVPHIIAHLK